MTIVRASATIAVASALALVAMGIQQNSSQSSSQTTSKDGKATASSSAQSRSSSSAFGSQSGIKSGMASGLSIKGPVYAAWMTLTPKASQVSDKVWQANQNSYAEHLRQQGVLVMDGPFTDGSGYLWILNVTNDEQAARVIQGNPLVQNGFLQVVIKRWECHTLADGTSMPKLSPGAGAGG